MASINVLATMRLLILVLLVGASKILFGQGAIDGYLKSKGEADIAVGLSATGADVFIGGDGTEYEIPFSGQLISAFGVYGINDKLNVIANIPLVITSSTAGLQDGGFFLKGLAKRWKMGENEEKSLDILGAFGVSLPLSQYEVVASGAIGQRAKVVQPRLVAQYNQPGFFASTVLGYNYRFDELDLDVLQEIQRSRPGYQPEQPQDFVTGLLRVGIPTRTFYADAWIEVQRTLGGSDFIPNVEELPQAYRVNYQQVGGTVYYSEGPTWGFAASGAAFLSGENTSRLWRISGTLIYKIRP
ncbi:MAG: hypothetical protein AB8F78_15160 [Saprospiraceae bacterium]